MTTQLSQEQAEQFSDILEELGSNLDITKTQYDAAVRSYEAVGAHLSKPDSALVPYRPEIAPQGSFMLGTMVKPVGANDELDLDLVCQLTGKAAHWTQKNLKDAVGDQLRSSERYKHMIKSPEGRRCWTLVYSEDAKYHMDILPSIVDSGYRILLEKAFSASASADVASLAMRITDKDRRDYPVETNHLKWLRSNPFGYAHWFFDRASLEFEKGDLLAEAVQPVRKYNEKKLPLQRVVQILKRHRDLHSNGHEHRPISIIITTLAARAYGKETNILVALQNVIAGMRGQIKEEYSPELGRFIKRIPNPVDESENFADRWIKEPERERRFYAWLDAVEADVANFVGARSLGVPSIWASLIKPFGEAEVVKAQNNYGLLLEARRKAGALRMAEKTATLGSAGRAAVPNHKFHGKEE